MSEYHLDIEIFDICGNFRKKAFYLREIKKKTEYVSLETCFGNNYIFYRIDEFKRTD